MSFTSSSNDFHTVTFSRTRLIKEKSVVFGSIVLYLNNLLKINLIVSLGVSPSISDNNVTKLTIYSLNSANKLDRSESSVSRLYYWTASFEVWFNCRTNFLN